MLYLGPASLIDISKIAVSVCLNFETLFTHAGSESEQSHSVTLEG